MARDIFCRWCDWPTEVVANQFPAICANCKRKGLWTTQPPAPASVRPIEPLKGWGYVLTGTDAAFLKSIRVRP